MDMQLMERRFKESGYTVARFKYNSTELSPSDNAEKLAEFVSAIESDRLHFVCHSLGGLVLRHFISKHKINRLGRSVMLGTPNQPSSAASTLKNWPFASSLLGNSLENGLSGTVPPWNTDYDLGVIAGDMRFGMGILIPDIPKPNDGTVSVCETKLDGLKDHIVLHVSHFGLLVSKGVFIQTEYFLKHGEFRHHG